MIELISELRRLQPTARSRREVAQLLRETAMRGLDELDALPYAKHFYTRTLLHREDAFEIVAIHWAPGAESRIHDHGDSVVWFAMLRGALTVENYFHPGAPDAAGDELLTLCDSAVLLIGDVDMRATTFDLHRVSNHGSEAAYSLHLYAKPMVGYRVYDDDLRHHRSCVSSYDADFSLLRNAT